MTVSQCDLKGPCGKVLDYVNQQVIRGFGDSSTQHELHQAPSRRFARRRLAAAEARPPCLGCKQHPQVLLIDGRCRVQVYLFPVTLHDPLTNLRRCLFLLVHGVGVVGLF